MDSDTEVLLAVAARRDHVINVIKPALESGQWVVCDRFTESTRAYQGGGGGVDMAWIDRLNQQATLGLKPDRTYLFDAPAELAAQRRSQRGRASDRFESQDAEFFDRVRDVYLNRPQVDSLKRLVIDSSETVTNIQKLLEKEVQKIVEEDEWLVVRPLTVESSLTYGAGTKWCTASRHNKEYFYRYSRNGVLFYVINKN